MRFSFNSLRALCCVGLLVAQSISAAPKIQGDAGLIGRDLSGAEVYLEPRLNPDSKLYFLSGRLRARADPESSVGRFEIRDSYLQIERGNWRGRLGFQSLSWGETYGLFIADLPNPRDWSDPRLLDIAYVKKPVFMAQLQWFGEWQGGPSSAQLFFTPITRNQEISSDWTLPNSTVRASEGGVRLTRLFESGLDASVFAISHLDRTPTLAPGRVFSLGVTATQSMAEEWIIRTDQVWSRAMDWDWRGVAGLHWSPTSDFTLGGQLQHDPRFWGASGIVRYQGLGQGWDLDAFAFLGLDQKSLWLQPKITYNASSGLSISVRYDWVESSQDSFRLTKDPSFLESLPQSDRVLLWISQRI